VDPPPRPYYRGNLPKALRAAAREILDETGREDVQLREVTRRIGVSASAAYRHFQNKDGLLASIAGEGFRELAVHLEGTAAADGDLLVRTGLAYVEFALQKRGLFRLMFGRILAERAKYPELAAGFDLIERIVARAADGPSEENAAALAAWGLIHGLSALFIDGLVPEPHARSLAEEVFLRWREAV
jgi:AcrR family transcriptional regulator